MSGRKGMLHYGLEVKKEAVRLVVEEHLTYVDVAARLEIRKAERIEVWVRMYRREGELSFHKPIGRPPKSQSEPRELERLRMENALLKKFHTELRGVRLAQRNIGRSTTTEKSTK
jgi:transposase-like protein